MESQDQKYPSCEPLIVEDVISADDLPATIATTKLYNTLSDAIKSGDNFIDGTIICTASPCNTYIASQDDFISLVSQDRDIISYKEREPDLREMPECPSCGARSYVKTKDGYRCEYCGNLVCI